MTDPTTTPPPEDPTPPSMPAPAAPAPAPRRPGPCRPGPERIRRALVDDRGPPDRHHDPRGPRCDRRGPRSSWQGLLCSSAAWSSAARALVLGLCALAYGRARARLRDTAPGQLKPWAWPLGVASPSPDHLVGDPVGRRRRHIDPQPVLITRRHLRRVLYYLNQPASSRCSDAPDRPNGRSDVAVRHDPPRRFVYVRIRTAARGSPASPGRGRGTGPRRATRPPGGPWREPRAARAAR